MSRTKKQELVSSFTHGTAGIFAILGTVLLIILSASHKTPWHVVSFSIYGATLILLYAASFSYHIVGAFRGYKKFFQSIDYAMISILIAGTYTPITLVSLRGAWGWSMFGVIWFMALAGIIVRYTSTLFRAWVPAVYYLLMGWIILIAINPLIKNFSPEALWLLFAGGALYTLGTIFYFLESRIKLSSAFGMHEIFHIFVILGSVSHFIMIYYFI